MQRRPRSAFLRHIEIPHAAPLNAGVRRPKCNRVGKMSTENPQQLLSALPIPSVSLGYATVKIYTANELEAQSGHSADPSGDALAGANDEGSWKTEWLVIGYEDLCGDPIFIDTACEGYPVYSAAHGEGDWQPRRIATSLRSFAQAIEGVSTLAKGRATPIELEANPLRAEEKATLLAGIQRENLDCDLEFWEQWLAE